MQLLANIAAGALLAGVSLGPTAWTEVGRIEHRLSAAALELIGEGGARSVLTDAASRPLPHLTHSTH